MKNNQWQVKIRLWEVMVFVLQCCHIKNILFNSIFLLFLEIKKGIFCPFQDFQGPQPKFKDFPGPGHFFHQIQDFPGFQEPWQPWIDHLMCWGVKRLMKWKAFSRSGMWQQLHCVPLPDTQLSLSFTDSLYKLGKPGFDTYGSQLPQACEQNEIDWSSSCFSQGVHVSVFASYI